MQNDAAVSLFSIPMAVALLLALLVHLILLLIPASHSVVNQNPETKHNKLDIEFVLPSQQKKSMTKSTTQSLSTKKDTLKKEPKLESEKKQVSSKKTLNRASVKKQISIDNLLQSVRQTALQTLDTKDRVKMQFDFDQKSHFKQNTNRFRAADLFRKYHYTKVASYKNQGGTTFVVLSSKSGKRYCFVVKPDPEFAGLAENLWYMAKCNK